MTDLNKDPKVTQAAEKVVDAAADAIKDAAKAQPAPAKAPKAPTGKVKQYVSKADAYVDNRYYKAGEPFVTNQPKGEDWDEINAKEAAAIEASTNKVPDDANLEAADASALQAVAIIKHVPITGIANDKKALITAIKAAYEPAL